MEVDHILDVSADTWDRMLAVNLTVRFPGAASAADDEEEVRGRMLFITSLHGRMRRAICLTTVLRKPDKRWS